MYVLQYSGKGLRTKITTTRQVSFFDFASNTQLESCYKCTCCCMLQCHESQCIDGGKNLGSKQFAGRSVWLWRHAWLNGRCIRPNLKCGNAYLALEQLRKLWSKALWMKCAGLRRVRAARICQSLSKPAISGWKIIPLSSILTDAYAYVASTLLCSS